MISFTQLSRSFKYAFKGLKHIFLNEQNFKIQLFCCLIVIALIFILQVSLLRAAVLILVCFWVLILEILNTVAERVTDILKPRLHHYVEVIKDLMAAAVLVSSFGAIIVGFLVFWPYILNLITPGLQGV